MTENIAFLSGGKLFIKTDEQKPLEHTSKFGEEMKERAVKIHQNRSWKVRDDEDNLINSRSVWGMQVNDPAQLMVHITAVARCKSNSEFIYALSTNVVGGLFLYNEEKKKEQRLFHKEGMVISDLSRHADEDEFVCALRNANGSSFIAMVGTSQCDQLTEGDCIDEAPSWIPGDKKEVLYHSAGIGRNNHGAAVGLSPYSIQRLNLENGSIEEVLESKDYDYMLPRMNHDKDMFFIKRPYEPFGKPQTSGDFLKDIVLFPYRLGKAFFAFLNFFSLTFTKEPLASSHGQKVKEMDVQKVFLRGRMLDAQEAMKGSKVAPEEAPLVPPDWELVKRSPDGKEETIARHVVAYDLDDDEKIIFSNGRATYKIEDGKEKLIFKSNLIESVTVLN